MPPAGNSRNVDFPMSTSSWLLITVPEGFSVEMPAWPTRSGSEEERPEGHMQVTTYNSKTSPFSCLVSIREGAAIANQSPRDLVESWKAEHLRMMLNGGIKAHLADERTLFGVHSGWDLIFERPEMGALNRVRLIREHDRLIALVALGPRELVHSDGEHFVKSFKRQHI
jgi:hypothetical protein